MFRAMHDILLVHENNTWQNSTANEGFESVGRCCLDLARGSQNIGDPFVHRCLCHRWTRNGSGAHASSSAHVGDEIARAVFFLSHHAARAARRPTDDPQITPSNRIRTHYDSNSTNQTKFTQTRRQTDISYKQRRKSYKIPDFHTNMMDFITFKWTTRC